LCNLPSKHYRKFGRRASEFEHQMLYNLAERRGRSYPRGDLELTPQLSAASGDYDLPDQPIPKIVSHARRAVGRVDRASRRAINF
jgi:hypothetical protein